MEIPNKGIQRLRVYIKFVILTIILPSCTHNDNNVIEGYWQSYMKELGYIEFYFNDGKIYKFSKTIDYSKIHGTWQVVGDSSIRIYENDTWITDYGITSISEALLCIDIEGDTICLRRIIKDTLIKHASLTKLSSNRNIFLNSFHFRMNEYLDSLDAKIPNTD